MSMNWNHARFAVSYCREKEGLLPEPETLPSNIGEDGNPTFALLPLAPVEGIVLKALINAGPLSTDEVIRLSASRETLLELSRQPKAYDRQAALNLAHNQILEYLGWLMAQPGG